jgi:hypothetical protein
VVPKISKNCPLELSVELVKEIVSVVCSGLYSKNKKLHEDENLREYSNKTTRDAALYAYTDDLATCSAGPQAKCMQQLQAKWLSAFCTFSGLTIHAGKIKATIVGNKID